MKTNKEVILIARSYLGQGGAIFRKFCGLVGDQAYCNAYVDYVAYKGGVSSLYWDGKKITYCPTAYAWCRKHLARVPLYLAMPSDPIFFDWDKNGVPNHIGFVEHKISTSAIKTIEGNTSETDEDGNVIATGVVAEKTRNGDYVLGIFRPHYKPKAIHLGRLSIDGDFGFDSIANLERALGMKPTGVLTKKVVKALQKKAGAKPDGDWGKETSKKVQKMTGAKVDGDFGVKSVKKLQQWTNKQNKVEPAEPEPEKPEPEAPKKYSGRMPKLPPKTAKIAVECAYAYKTSPSVYKYSTGKPKKQYKKRLNEAYPSRKHWKHAKSRAGASCDVFAGTVLKCSGYKKAPHAMSKMVAWCRKHLKRVKTAQNGDILTRTNHVMIFLELNGKKFVANAHFLNMGGTYGYVEKPSHYTDIWRPSGLSYFSKGDKFTDVKYLRRYLNWYGQYGLDEDRYDFNENVERAVKDFQTREGLEVTGKFGKAEIERAEVVTR